MKEFKIGVIGFGNRGYQCMYAHKTELNSRVVACADVNISAQEKFKQAVPDFKYVTDDYRKILADKEIDAVFILTPDYLHEEHAVAALEAGKHCYLEKPMATTIAGCDRIMQTAYHSGSRLFVGHNMRHFPVVEKMKEIIDSGAIGEIKAVWCRHFIDYGGDAYFRDWHSEQKNTCGLMLQKGAHDIDVIHYLSGAYTSAVNGMGMLSVYNKCERRTANEAGSATWNPGQYPPLEQHGFSPVIDVEDHAMIMMQLSNGIQACYMHCHFTPDNERNYTFIGTRGRIENIGDSDSCQIHLWNRRGRRSEPDVIYQLKPIAGAHGGSDPGIVANFVDFARNNAKSRTSPVAARNAVAVGVLGHESMRSDGARRSIPHVAEYLIKYFDNNQEK